MTICALDISKAFDRVDQYALLRLLMDRNMPKYFINVMSNWFEKGCAYVRWGNAMPSTFSISAGVRQGGLLSPLLFAVYMDVLIIKLRDAGFGCKLAQRYFGCLFYADDIVLLAHSLNAIRKMLSICIAKFLGHSPLFFSYLGPPIINPHFIIIFTFSISFLPFFVL